MAAQRRRRASTSDRVLRILIVVLLVAVGIVGGLLVSRSGKDQPAVSDAVHAVTATSTTRPKEPPTTTTVPPTTVPSTTIPPTTTTTSVCDESTPIDGCPVGTPAAIAWAQQQDQAAQAAAVQQIQQAYEQCLNVDAEADTAAIAQGFGDQVPAGTPAWEPCSTAGLTPAQIQQAQQAVGG